ncbi:metallophosphoesterase family protein [Thiohalorhabdus sp.]|uniref:metallophosphoesterase family protein n=1 Tax=Thiohalorhabdus sp. TaxID=3094134 RepID=UPI002FC3761E
MSEQASYSSSQSPVTPAIVSGKRLTEARVAILSDTHGHLDPRIAETIAGTDYAIHAGDIMGAEILEALRARTGEVVAVAGNNDQPGIWPDGAEEVVRTLPRIAHLHLPGGTLAVEHGHYHGHTKPDHGSLRDTHAGSRLVVYGHTHRVCDDCDADPRVVNPGAAGRTRTHGAPSCLILHAGSDEWVLETFRFPQEAVRA